MSAALVVLATARHDIARYVDALFTVYFILIFAYVVLNVMFSFGIRPPYARWSNAILAFLRDVVEPYLRIFRRILPSFGPLDFSPMLAIVVLFLVRSIVVPLIDG